MDENLLNANPTILSAADLPTRKREKRTKQRGIFDELAIGSSSSSTTTSKPVSSLAAAASWPLSSSSLLQDNTFSDLDDEEEEEDLSDRDSTSSSATRLLETYEEIDAQEVYDLIAPISDPEHPLSLGSLGVVTLEDISVDPPLPPRSSNAAFQTALPLPQRQQSRIAAVHVLLTPTTSACSLTTVIGLGVKVRLLQALPPRFRVDVRIKPGTSRTADEVNKQLGDKERIAAAMENKSLASVVAQMLSTCD